MTTLKNIPSTFSISASAKKEIDKLQTLWAQKASDEAIALCLSWATYHQYDGKSWENVAVSFYGRSQQAEIEPLIRDVSGVKVVFFLTAADIDKFAGRILDYNTDRGIFLNSEVASGDTARPTSAEA